MQPIREMVDTLLRELSHEFVRLYPKTRRPSIPPEKLLRARLVQVLYSIRSERQLRRPLDVAEVEMEQLDHNLVFRWFVGLSMAFLAGQARVDKDAGGLFSITLKGRTFLLYLIHERKMLEKAG